MTQISEQVPSKRSPWNKARFTGPKPPLKPKQIWGIRARLQIGKRTRDLALFDLALDSKLRGCDLVRVKISDIALHGAVQTRAIVTQRHTSARARLNRVRSANENGGPKKIASSFLPFRVAAKLEAIRRVPRLA